MSRRIIVLDGVTYVRADSLKSSVLPDGLEAAGKLAQDVIKKAAQLNLMRPEELTGRGSSRRLTRIRVACSLVLREFADLSWAQVGEALGGRDHSTMIKLCQKHGDDRHVVKLRKRLVDRLALDVTGGGA